MPGGCSSSSDLSLDVLFPCNLYNRSKYCKPILSTKGAGIWFTLMRRVYGEAATARSSSSRDAARAYISIGLDCAWLTKAVCSGDPVAMKRCMGRKPYVCSATMTSSRHSSEGVGV